MINEVVKPADKNSKGPFAIATKTRSGTLRRVPDTRFDAYDSAHKYGMQYHTDRYGSQMFHVVHHPDAKKRMDEDLGGGPGSPTTSGIANVAGAGVSTDPVHWSKRQPRMGMKGTLKKYGQPMMFKAIIRRKETNESTVYYKALGKRVKAVSRTSAMGGGSDGSSGGGNGGESTIHETLKKVDGKWALVSKSTGRPLAYYKGEGKPPADWVARQEKRIQYFKHKG